MVRILIDLKEVTENGETDIDFAFDTQETDATGVENCLGIYMADSMVNTVAEIKKAFADGKGQELLDKIQKLVEEANKEVNTEK